MNYYLGIDVGTGSARVGLFSAKGKMIISKKEDITLWSYDGIYKEQSSEEIWDKICNLTSKVVKESKIDKENIKGIGFDATCSLVAIDKDGDPVSLSKSNNKNQNIILWMDHRAEEQANRINETKAEALKYIGGKISLEMEIPKILWLKENMKESYDKITDFFDLPDYLVYKACGEKVRSVCSLGCKWTYLAHEKKWDEKLLKKIGLSELLENNANRIGKNIKPIGTTAGKLTKDQSEKMGLIEGIDIGVSMIDAHAGGLGILGIELDSKKDLKNRIALISGTSNCHMAVSEKAIYVPGIWGPYYDAMLPDMWLLEGGQSTAGALIDHVIKNHGAYISLIKDSKEKKIDIYENLNNILYSMKKEEIDYLTKDIHTLPYFLGNRSPIADPTLMGVMTGLTMDISIQNLALQYYSTLQSIAYGTKHIIDELNKTTFEINEIYITGGGTKNPLLLKAYANITGCKVILAKEEESVLLGASILGAVAGNEYSDVFEAMKKMTQLGKIIEPNLKTIDFHNKKYLIFREIYSDYKKYIDIMK